MGVNVEIAEGVGLRASVGAGVVASLTNSAGVGVCVGGSRPADGMR